MTLKQFDMIKDNVIYIDWNLLSDIFDQNLSVKNPNLSTSVNALKEILINKLNPATFVVPYSHGHFLDIRNGAQELVAEKLTKLGTLSENWEISEDKDDQERVRLEKTHIHEWYAYCDRYLSETRVNMDQLNQLLSPLLKMQKDTFEYYAEIEGTPLETKESLKKLAQHLAPTDSEEKNIELLKLAKNTRLNAKDSGGQKIRFPIYESVKKKHPNLRPQELVDMAFKISDLPCNSLAEALKVVPWREIPGFSKFHNQVSNLYSLAEFVGVSSEKLKSKTAFQGITNDHFHLSYGLRCHVFLTADDALFRKAVFIRDWLGMSTKIFKAQDFIALFSK
jgi:hypothetical protein